MIDFSIALPLVATSALGAPVGAYVTQFVPTAALLALFAVAVLFTGGRMLTVVFSSVTGFLGHLAVGHVEWALMIYTALAVVVGSQLGAHVMHTRMRPRQLKHMFGVVLIFVAGKLIWGLL